MEARTKSDGGGYRALIENSVTPYTMIVPRGSVEAGTASDCEGYRALIEDSVKSHYVKKGKYTK